MRDLPPDLARLGDALESAVGRAIARRRAQLRAAWALGAVVAAVPMAVVATHLHLRSGEGRLPAGVPISTVTAADDAAAPRSPGRVLRGDRLPRDRAAARRRGAVTEAPPHPLDTMSPPVSARAMRTYKKGVATERVDRRPPFVPTLI